MIPLPLPSRLLPRSLPTAWLTAVFAVAVNLSMAIGHLVARNWLAAGVHALLAAGAGALMQASVSLGHRHELLVKKVEADTAAAQHMEQLLAKQLDVLTHEFSSRVVGERRH